MTSMSVICLFNTTVEGIINMKAEYKSHDTANSFTFSHNSASPITKSNIMDNNIYMQEVIHLEYKL